MSNPSLPGAPGTVQVSVEVPADRRDEFVNVWTSFLSGQVRPIGVAHRKIFEMAPAVAALKRLYDITAGDTGQARVIARFLAGLYNGMRFPFDLSELRAIDDALFEDCMLVLKLDARHCKQEVHCYFEDGQTKWETMIADWRLLDHQQLLAGRTSPQ